MAEWFGGVRGRRKTMLLISEGIDYDITDIIRQPDAPSSSAQRHHGRHPGRDRRHGALQRQHLRHRSARADDRRTTTRSASRRVSPIRTTPQRGRSGQRSLNNELRLSQDSLRQLAEETGGFAAVNRNDFATAFDRIVRDNSSYYVLAYYPPSDKRDGKFHRIEVKVNRPGSTVRSRRGYTVAARQAGAAEHQDRAACRRSCSKPSTARCRSAA